MGETFSLSLNSWPMPQLQLSIPTAVAPQTREKPADKAKEPVTADKLTFVAANNSLFQSDLQFGLLPFNNNTGRLLLSGILSERRASDKEDFWAIRYQKPIKTFEPQLQLNLPNLTNLHLRTPITVTGEGNSGEKKRTDFLADLTVTHRYTDMVARAEYGVNGIGRDDSYSYATLTPYYRFHLYQDWLIFRLGTKMAHYMSKDKNTDVLTVEAKLEGTMKKNPWSGWGVQLFVPTILTKELQPWERRTEIGGVYAWLGSVLPNNWLGQGFFAEGGLWVGGRIDESEHKGHDILAGINVKIKFGSEARWWQ